MSNSTLVREPRQSAAMLFSTDSIARELTPKQYFKKGDDGANILVLEEIALFRSGTFRDSMGFQMTWESIHMDQMVAHFDMLRSRSIFSDVPVRDGHPGFLVSGQAGNGKVVGWHTSLRVEQRTSSHDGKEYTYLIGSYEIIDPEAQAAIQSGLWRNRSAEVGTYVTNDEAEFWPVYMGVAYVDIPAVEGLNAFSKQHKTSLMMEEGSMSSNTSQVAAPQAPTPPVPPAAPAAPETAPPVAQHAARTEVQAFSLAGESVSDFARVQTYITSLETRNAALTEFQNETLAAARSAFVNQLAADGRILATQIEALGTFAQSLSPEQFDSWSTAMSAVPANPVLGQYGSSTTEGAPSQPTGEQPSAAEVERDIDLGIIKAHKRSGMTVDKIKATASYGRIIAADPAFKL